MTPAATTPAGRAASNRRAPSPGEATRSASGTSAGAGTSAIPGHRRRIRPHPAPKAPRRVSGPVRGRAAESAPPPLHVGAPRRRRTRARRAPRRAPGRPLGSRALAFVQALPDHPLLDRLIRGRAWIPVLGVLLAGIVAMQVEVLKLGTSIGRSIERSTTLQTRNDQLRMTVAALDGDQRIERLAAAHGMIMPAPDAIGFLSSGEGARARQAIASIHAPDATSFLSQTSSNGGIATVASSAAATDASGSSTDTASGSSTGIASGSSTDTTSGSSASTTSDSSASTGAGIVGG